MTASYQNHEGHRAWPTLLILACLACVPGQNRAAGLSGNMEAGKDIAETQQKCVRCHGRSGVSDDPDTPHLAAQNAEYLLKQMKDFKSKKRLGPNMYKRVRKFDEQQMTDIALWYGSQTLPEIEPVAGQDLRVPQLVQAGDPARAIPPCELCHAKDGRTVSGELPVLAGQSVDYLISALEYFRDDLRTNDPGGVMETISKKLLDVEIEALARYYAALGGRPAR